MSDTSSEHAADSLGQTHSTATTTTTAASGLKADAVEIMPMTRTSSTLLARDGRGGGAREQQQQQQCSPTTSNASVLVRSTSPSTSTAATSWPQASSAGSCLSSSCTTSPLASLQQQQQPGSHHCHAQHNSHHHLLQQQQHTTPQPPRSVWQTAVSTMQKMAAVRGKPWIALGVCIIAVELVVLIGMFSSMPVIDEFAELTTVAVQEVLRAGVEWVTPEAWSRHLVLNIMASDALIRLFRVRVTLVANASRPHALEQALHSLVTSRYSSRNAAVDLHVYVHADVPACTSARNDDTAAVSACAARQQLHAATMRTLDSVAWTQGRYEVHLVSGSDDCTVHGGTSNNSSNDNTTPGCAARMLRSLWYPTSMWEVSLLLDDRVRLSPLWHVQLARLMRRYVMRDGVYEFLLSHNAYAPALNDDGTPRQWHMAALTARNASDTLLGLALHDTFPVATTATTTTATAATTTLPVQLDVLTRAGNGAPYVAQLVGMYGTLFLPYSWRSMITWLQEQQQQQQQQEKAATTCAGGNDNKAAAAAVLPGWRTMQRYVEAQGIYVLYPSSPNNAAVATLDVDEVVYKTAVARAYARSQQLPNIDAVERQRSYGDGDKDDDDDAADTNTHRRSTLDRYDASGALLLRGK